MKQRRAAIFGACCLPAVAIGLAMWRFGGERVEGEAEAHRRAVMYPDYADAVVPPNIAPLNFRVLEEGRKYSVRWSGAAGAPIELVQFGADIRIPADGWRRLLEAN